MNKNSVLASCTHDIKLHLTPKAHTRKHLVWLVIEPGSRCM